MACVTALLGAGCGNEGGWRQEVHDDESAVCRRSGPPYGPADDEHLSLEVYFDIPCYGSGCSRHEDSECSVSTDGNRILLDATVVIGVEVAPQGCTDDCASYTAVCSVGTLEPGDWEVHEASNPEGSPPLLTFTWPLGANAYPCTWDDALPDPSGGTDD